MLGPISELRICSIEEQHYAFSTTSGVAILWIPNHSRNRDRDQDRQSKELTNFYFSFSDWNMQFQTWTGWGKDSVTNTSNMHSVDTGRGNGSPGQQVILKVCFNTVQTGHADLNKPFEWAAFQFWYSYLCGRKLKELCPDHSLLSSRTTLGITTRRKTKLLLRLCWFLSRLYSKQHQDQTTLS